MKAELFTFALITPLGCAIAPQADVATQVFTDKGHMAAMSSAKRVTAHRLHWKSPDQDPLRLSNYVQRGNVQLSDSQVTELKQMLRRPSSYAFDSVKGCIPDYGVVFVFHSEPKDLRVALCFNCSTLGVFDGDSRLNTEEDFDPIRKKLVALVKTLFAKDSEIQKLL